MSKRRHWKLVDIGIALVLALGSLSMTTVAALGAGAGQGTPITPVPTTTIADTIYRADGTAAAGTVLVSWPAFVTATGRSVAAGSTSVTLGAGGALNIALVANTGATPVGGYYTVIYHLDDGSTMREYWVVPASTFAVTLTSIRNQVLPTSVAMQTVSKSYVDTAIAVAVAGAPLDSSPYVLKAGDSMTGALTLPGAPVAPLQAADKSYVDGQIAALGSGIGQKVSLAPAATQVVAQPAGTSLEVNTLNNAQYASQFQTGVGANGIANAAASSNCTTGCTIVAEPTYPATERVTPQNYPSLTSVEDQRGGSRRETFFNPLNILNAGQNTGFSIDTASTQTAQSVKAASGAGIIYSTTLQLLNEGLAGGSNAFPEHIQGTVPYFKTTYSALNLLGTESTPGQHVLMPQTQNCYGVGDCLMGSLLLQASGGFRDDADEGAHPYDLNITEDGRIFQGTCSTGCTTGSTQLQLAVTASPATQGDGRFLIDKNPANVITTGAIAGGSPTGGRQPLATFSGTSFPVSTLFATAISIPTQANSINPGIVSVPIVTSGAPSGFATNTGALTATTGVACLSDVAVGDGRSMNFETAAYSVVDASHLQLTLNRPHGSGATIAVGGLCGYGLEQTADTVNGIRQVFPVIGSPSANSLLYAGGNSALIGVQGLSSAYVNLNLVVAAIARTGNVVTVTTAGNLPVDVNGLTLNVQGVSDASYNGSFLVSTTGTNTLTYASSGANSTSTGGTLSMVNGGYALYPMAEVLQVYNATTHAIDGQMMLAANNVAWASGDALEQPHYFQENVHADIESITQYTPRPTSSDYAGITYNGNNGPGIYGWQISNATPVTSYFGNGGTHTAPSVGINVTGVWHHALELEAGEDAAVEVHCNSHGCNTWNSAYDLFQLDTAVGVDRLNYSPATSTMNWSLRGSTYQFAPGGFTAGTINVTTLNAAHVNGALTGSFAGSITPASLPLFIASGAGHMAGAVPDPGPTAGITRFLREDGTWAVGGSGGATGPAGPAGATGPAGAAGANGAAGTNGAAGATGPIGPAGATGANGAPGTAGATGPAGTAGAPGTTGPTGLTGATGATGATGPAGPTVAATSSSLGAVQLAAGQTSATLGTASGQPISAFAANNALGVIGAARGTAFTTLDTVYDFTSQTGTTVFDRIGTNNGTLAGTTLPTWTGNGLAFGPSARVTLPAALNTERTFYFAVAVNPITSGTQTSNVFPAVMSSSTGGTGFNVMLESPGSIASGLSDFTYSPTIYPNALSTSSASTLSGFAVLTVVCGTSSSDLDHFYLNGAELTYTTQAFNCGAQTSGNLNLGTAGVGPWNNGFFPGTFYGFGASSTQHTLAQVQQNVSAFLALANAKGVPVTPQPVSLPTPQLYAVGDSITAGANGATPYTSLLTLANQPAYSITNAGIIGIRLASILSHEANRTSPRCNVQGGQAVAILEAGTNDLSTPNALAPQAVWNSAAAWAALMRRSGCIPFVIPMISRTGSGFGSQTLDQLKDTYDALILQQAKAVGFAGVLDTAANPLLGADGANTNTTYFQATDHIHPTTAGNTLMAAAISNGLNYYFGFNEANPHVLSTLYGFTMTCSDGYLDLTGLTASGNITLPDCTGATSATYRINNPQSTYAVTVTADSASHPVNGSSTAVTVPAGGTLSLRLVANPKTSSGWHWEL